MHLNKFISSNMRNFTFSPLLPFTLHVHVLKLFLVIYLFRSQVFFYRVIMDMRYVK